MFDKEEDGTMTATGNEYKYGDQEMFLDCHLLLGNDKVLLLWHIFDGKLTYHCKMSL